MGSILVGLGLLCLMFGAIAALIANRNPVVSIISLVILLIGFVGIFASNGKDIDPTHFNTVICVSEKKCYYATVLARAPYSQSALMNLATNGTDRGWQESMLLEDTRKLTLDFK